MAHSFARRTTPKRHALDAEKQDEKPPRYRTRRSNVVRLPGTRDGLSLYGARRLAGAVGSLPSATAASSSIIRPSPSRKVSAERQPLDLQASPPALETKPVDGPVLPY
ncbi:hypothetical protein SCMC78_13190 [Streptomyces sp. CMC78]|uniref:Uncharacterized protein n=1 Tax=Streptomyces sp. CMC78 TaxID=3231512 RepID=A0AB33K9X3_9ACTN